MYVHLKLIIYLCIFS